jgi:hypothetical protein
MGISRPVSYPAAESYVLAGRVGGYIGPFAARNIRGEIRGLRLRDVIVVSSPKPLSSAEVFEYLLAADCETISYGRESIEPYFH